jgi:uncharacterized protein (TIGR03086 family)
MEMKTDVSAAYARAIEQAARVVGGIGSEQLDAATPCQAWNTRELLNHFVGSNLMMATVGSGKSMGEASSGTEAVAGLGDVVGDDPAGAYASASSAALQAFSAPGALERVWTLPFGEMPGAAALNIHFVETLAHTWDIAKTTGQLDKLDPELAVAGETVARGFVRPEFRNEQGNPFAAEIAVPADAAPYDRLVGFLGRRS